MADPQWAGPIHEYYGSAPCWDAGDEFGLGPREDEAPPNYPERGDGPR